MPKHVLYLVTYDRGTHPLTGQPRPHHWSFFLQSDHRAGSRGAGQPEGGVIFQLRGMPGGFQYPGPERLGITQGGEDVHVKETLEVGQVDDSDGGQHGAPVERIHGVLDGVPIVVDEGSAWNCQDWALEGLERLKCAGVVYGHLTGAGVREWLRER